jgi:UPF0176 protein
MSEIYPVILFYKYVEIAEPEEFCASQRALCERLGLKGRILIAKEGINGTLAGPSPSVDEYVSGLLSDPRFAGMEIKVTPGNAQTFRGSW